MFLLMFCKMKERPHWSAALGFHPHPSGLPFNLKLLEIHEWSHFINLNHQMICCVTSLMQGRTSLCKNEGKISI
jgi:hypothetical protein